MLADFRLVTLGNGTRVHLMPTDRFRTLTVRAYLQRPLEPGANTEVALVTRLIGRGCRHFPTAQALARHLDNLYGTAAGTGVGKNGMVQLAYFHLEIPAEAYLPAGASVTAPALTTLRQLMTAPVVDDGAFPAGVVAQEASYLARDIRGLINDRTRYSVLRCTEEMCQNGPHGLSELGRLEDLETPDPGRLYLRYRELMDHGPMDVFAIGPMPDGTGEQLADAFDFPRHPVPVLAGDIPPRPGSGVRQVLEELDIGQARLCLGLRYGIPPGHADYYALLMYDGILGGFPHSKLFMQVREMAGFSYDVWSFVYTALGFQYVVAGVSPDHHRQVIDIIEEQRRQLSQGEVSGHELESTRAALVGRARAVRDSPARMIGAAYAGLLTGRMDSPEEQVALLQSVNVDDVVRVAQGVELDTVYLLAPGGGGIGAAADRN